MKIRHKLFVLLGTLIASLILLGAFSIFELNKSHRDSTELNEDVQLQRQLKHIQYRLAGLSNDERAFLIQGDPKFPEQMKEKAGEVQDSIEMLRGMARTSEEKQTIAEIEKGFKEYWNVSEEVVSLYSSSSKEAMDLHFGEERNIRKEILDPAIEDYLVDLTKETEADSKQMDDRMNSFVLILIVITVGVSIACAVFGTIIIASIVKPLNRLGTQMKEIATGEADLTKQIMVKNKDELSELASSFNDFIRSIREIILNIKSSSEQVAASSEEFSASAEQAKTATEQLSHSMQEIAASSGSQLKMTEESTIALKESLDGLNNITSTTTGVADTTIGVKEKAEGGVQSVTQIIGQMQSIHSSVENTVQGITSLSDSAEKISHITALINDISAQTNLLALNAAIEAARAGEQGKGFAVVADEVRKLAEQSSKSANQITEIIVSIQKETEDTVDSIQNVKDNVSSGMAITTEAATQFNEILHSIEAVSSQIQEIAATAGQLNSGFELVTTSVNEISVLTKETTSGVGNIAASTEEQLASSEEILHSARSLSSLAEELQTMITRFKI
ncbi:methyl-accepting chemotaxis protein [Bacillus sp. V59.32b]|uniref:methyl-accepting chemotaxis protein n=1 Tax=Bacillus sp. V59.32b TaxID=1758642 RepID=UPI000E3E794B|nr:HAMP domain-containing methyl-accepting chemotaxis protein [Bacillus sp. V59.32b]RFU61089.1 methyl-accepting chemotaxis protein [Bacillus sp. V59.32b]